MSYLHEEEAYEKDHVFSQDDLAALTPSDIKRWMCEKAYGTPKPGPNDHPALCRSTSLEFWKKATSSFIPNRLMSWNIPTNVGNPTKSIEINDLIKSVKKRKFANKARLQLLDALSSMANFRICWATLEGRRIRRSATPFRFFLSFNPIS
jgi:hypothetical protein